MFSILLQFMKNGGKVVQLLLVLYRYLEREYLKIKIKKIIEGANDSQDMSDDDLIKLNERLREQRIKNSYEIP